MVRDGGATVIFQWTYSQSKPHDVIWNQNFGHLGTGLPYAVGASVADGGKRPVMLLTSDSSFLFHIAELETAARLKLPLVCVVGVDHQWGLEVGVYKRTFGQAVAGDRGALEQGRAASTRSPRASAATANMSRGRRRSARRSRAPTPAARSASFTCASTRRSTRRRCRSTTSSGPGTPKARSNRDREGEPCANT